VALTNTALGFGVRALGLAQALTEAAGAAARGLASLPRLVDVLERIADETASIRKLAQSEDLRAVPKAMESLLATTKSLQPLATAVNELNRAVAQLNATISPLQGTAERLGRLVDRFPARGRREQTAAIARPFVAPTES
jgi:methyl-accepting chemotaxis protein